MAYFQDPIVKAINGLGNYAYLPPRLSYFPPDPPYLGGLRGLGSYATDVAAYERDHAAWLQEKANYERAMAAFVASIGAQTQAYQQALATYNAAKSAWDRDAAAYNGALLSYNAQVSAQRAANIQKANEIAKAHGITLQQWVYDQGGCLTPAQQANYRAHCQSVRGLGAGELFTASTNCAYAKLPICNFPTRPTLRSPPSPPVKPSGTTTPPSLRPEPKPPVAPPTMTTVPRPGATPIPVSTTPPKWPTAAPDPGSSTTPLTPTEEAEDLKNKNLVMSGLLIVALVGGSYLIYRTVKKPKAAA
jgi:hypothetical protein